jgi:hypothetical protein
LKLYYYKGETPNFGDDLNEWIWPKVLPDFFDNDPSHLVIGIGSILNHKIPASDNYTVIGSGYGYGTPPIIDSKWRIICLRGKISCNVLNVSENMAVLDPAYLIRNYFQKPIKCKFDISLIPHADSLEKGDWENLCNSLNINFIDIRTRNIEQFVTDVRSSKTVLCEAMHGAIIADAFGIPWQGYKAYQHIDQTKWNDWLSVFNIEVSLIEINSLFSKKRESSFTHKCKNGIKIILKKVGIWCKTWDDPAPLNTTTKNQKIIQSQITSIINNNKFFINDRFVVDQQISKLEKCISLISPKANGK